MYRRAYSSCSDVTICFFVVDHSDSRQWLSATWTCWRWVVYRPITDIARSTLWTWRVVRTLRRFLTHWDSPLVKLTTDRHVSLTPLYRIVPQTIQLSRLWGCILFRRTLTLMLLIQMMMDQSHRLATGSTSPIRTASLILKISNTRHVCVRCNEYTFAGLPNCKPWLY